MVPEKSVECEKPKSTFRLCFALFVFLKFPQPINKVLILEAHNVDMFNIVGFFARI